MMRELIEMLEAEQADLDTIVSGLSETQWDLPTEAEPWTIRDVVSHLAFFDERQCQAILDPAGFAEEVNQRLSGNYDDYMALALTRGREMTTERVLSWWREARSEVVAAFAGCEPEQTLPWYGPPMKARSAVTARLMETWAHGFDIADALGLSRALTDRLFAIAELGVKTFSWSFANRGLPVPESKVRVALRGPAGRTRVWNDDCNDSITGPVEQFCLVMAQRLNYRDTDLVVEGQVAQDWLEVAQIFAGPPGPGRASERDRFPVYVASHPADA